MIGNVPLLIFPAVPPPPEVPMLVMDLILSVVLLAESRLAKLPVVVSKPFPAIPYPKCQSTLVPEKWTLLAVVSKMFRLFLPEVLPSVLIIIFVVLNKLTDLIMPPVLSRPLIIIALPLPQVTLLLSLP